MIAFETSLSPPGPTSVAVKSLRPLASSRPGHDERGGLADRQLGDLLGSGVLELSVDPDRRRRLAGERRRDGPAQVDRRLVGVGLGRDAQCRRVRGDRLDRARARTGGDLGDRLRSGSSRCRRPPGRARRCRRRRRRRRARRCRRPGGRAGRSASPSHARSCGAGPGGSGQAAGSMSAWRVPDDPSTADGV